MTKLIRLTAALMCAPILLSGCATAAYNIQERFGIEKRDILVDRVGDVSKAQTEAKEEFADALEAFRSVVNVEPSELEDAYDDINKAYKRSEAEAEAVRTRVKSVKRVSADLFKEWESELNQYSDAGLRRASETQLRDTEARYEVLVDRMDAATASMDPVLSVFKDRVLYLKHNLNARAIAALYSETPQLESDVERLIRDMERSIAAADSFIADMQG